VFSQYTVRTYYCHIGDKKTRSTFDKASKNPYNDYYILRVVLLSKVLNLYWEFCFMLLNNKKIILSIMLLMSVHMSTHTVEPTDGTQNSEIQNTATTEQTLTEMEIQTLFGQMQQQEAYALSIILQLEKTLQKKQPKNVPALATMAQQLNSFAKNFGTATSLLWQEAPANHVVFLEKIAATFSICNKALSSTLTVITSNFKVAPNSDCLVPDKTIGIDKTIDELKQEIMTLAQTIEKTATAIHTASDLIGITTTQKLSRAIGKYIVDPINKYNLQFWVPLATAATLCAAYVYWQNFCPRSGEIYKQDLVETPVVQFDGSVTMEKATKIYGQEAIEHIKAAKEYNSLTKWLFEKLGPAHHITQSGFADLHESDRYKINGSLLTLRHYLGNHDPLATLTVGGLGGLLLPKVIDLKTSLQQTATALWNRARGGDFVDLPVPGNFEKLPRHTLADVIGLHKIKERVRAIIDYAINPALFRTGGKVPCCNLIFHGITRAGKSYMAEGIAGSIMARSTLPFCYIEIPVTALKEFGVFTVLSFIKSKAPCIAFIDEFDLSGPNRAMNMPLVNELLHALGQGETLSNDPYKPIVLITACNKLEGIDEALRTIGRFGIEIPFKYPEPVDRAEFIEHYLAKNTLNNTQFDIARLVQKTRNHSFEKIELCLKCGINKCLKTGNVSQYVLEESIDETLYALYHRILPGDLHPAMQQLLAVHFAGRALGLLLTPGIETLDIVTINNYDIKVDEATWEGNTGKQSDQKKIDYGAVLTRGFADETYSFIPPDALHADIMQLVAGFVAEELLFGACTNTCHRYNVAMAFYKASALESHGLRPDQIETLSEQRREEISNAAFARLERCKSEMRSLLEKNQAALIATAQSLQLLGTLDDRVVQNILDNPHGALVVIMQAVQSFEEADPATIPMMLENLHALLRDKGALKAYADKAAELEQAAEDAAGSLAEQEIVPA
jgi:ATP-dependent Zn protease